MEKGGCVQSINIALLRSEIPNDRVFVTLPTFHNEDNAPHRANVLKRVTFDRDHVGEVALLNCADLTLHPEQLRAADRCGSDSIKRLHSVIDHQVEFARAGPVLVGAYVCAEHNLYARDHRLAKDLSMVGDDPAAQIDVVFLMLRYVNAERRAPENASLNNEIG